MIISYIFVTLMFDSGVMLVTLRDQRIKSKTRIFTRGGGGFTVDFQCTLHEVAAPHSVTMASLLCSKKE